MITVKNPIKLNGGKRLLFVSDLHLNHDKEFLWGKRGYSSSAEHKRDILAKLGAEANDETILINLGDAAFRDPEHETFDLLAALPFYQHFHVWGNHPSGAKQAYRASVSQTFAGNIAKPLLDELEIYPVMWHNVTFLGYQSFFRYQDQTIFANHFPQAIWDEMKNDVWHVAGHSHGSFDATNGQSTMDGKIMDVGVEQSQKYNDGNPFLTFEQVKAFMDARAVVKKDHH